MSEQGIKNIFFETTVGSLIIIQKNVLNFLFCKLREWEVLIKITVLSGCCFSSFSTFNSASKKSIFSLFLILLFHTSSFCLPENNGKQNKQKDQNYSWVDQMIKEIEVQKEMSLPSAEKLAKTVLNVARELEYQEGERELSFLLADILLGQDKTDTALVVINTILNRKDAKEKRNIRGYIIRGAIYNEKNIPDSALLNYQMAGDLLSRSIDERLAAMLFSNRADTKQTVGRSEDAIHDYLKAIRIYEDNHMQKQLAIAYNNIALVYQTMNEDSSAIGYLKKAIKIDQRLTDKSSLANCYSNIGTSYKNIDSIQQAILYYRKAIALAEETRDKNTIARNQFYLGSVYQDQANYERALGFFTQSLAICRELGSDYGIMMNMIDIGINCRLTGDFVQSAHYLDQALELAEKMKLPHKQSHIYQQLAGTYNCMDGDEKRKTYEYLEKFYTIRNSISDNKKQEYVKELEGKYEIEKKEVEILVLQRKVFWLLAFFFVVSFIAVFFFILYLRYKYLQSIAENGKRREKERNNHLSVILDEKKKELVVLANQLVKNKEKTEQVINKILHIVSTHEGKNSFLTKKIEFSVRRENSLSNVFDEFEKRLEENNEEFYQFLLERFPTLSPTELKICALLRMNLSTKEISQITNRSSRTIDFTRNKIRKKLGIDQTINLSLFLLQVQ